MIVPFLCSIVSMHFSDSRRVNFFFKPERSSLSFIFRAETLEYVLVVVVVNTNIYLSSEGVFDDERSSMWDRAVFKFESHQGIV